MYLSRFKVQNYKCLADVDIPLTPFHVIIGENDSGKTSLLEAIGKLYGPRSLVDGPSSIGFDQLVFHGQKEILLEGMLTKDSQMHWGVRLGLRESSEGKCRVQISVLPGKEQLFEGPPSEVQKRLARCPDDGDDAVILEELKKMLGHRSPYSFDPQVMRLPCALDPNRRFKIDFDGFGLATYLDDILSGEAEQFTEISNEFCERFPQFSRVALETANGVRRTEQGPWGIRNLAEGSSAGKAIVFTTSKGLRLSASQVSDGAIVFLALLALAHIPDPPKLLLIEEPENGVYPKRLREMIQLMRSLVERKDGPVFPQIILSTHSPYVLTDFAPEEVTFLSRYPDDPGKGVRARPLSTANNLESYGKEFFLGELWFNLTEEELFGEP